MYGNSPPVDSSQIERHSSLEKVVKKHMTHPYQKPISEYQRSIFRNVEKIIEKQDKPLIIDAGCGTGESTQNLAHQFPDMFVLGIDKSLHRLNKTDAAGDNYILVRADLVDFWMLAIQAQWNVARHYLLYPNPYPKSIHLKRRWHGHPIFPYLIQLGDYLEVRSNWHIYVEEFAFAYTLVMGVDGKLISFVPPSPLTPFERKYRDSGHTLWRWYITQEMKGKTS